MEIKIFGKGFNFSQDGPGNRLVYHLQGCNMRCPWCSNPEGLSIYGGQSYSIEAMLDEIMRSKSLFFQGGGVTLTGGEVSLQFDAVKELLKQLKEKKIHTCIETNGSSSRLKELFPYLDFLIMDCKHYNPIYHQQFIGVSCQQTHDNILEAIHVKQQLLIRIPLINGFNASQEDAIAFANLFTKLQVPQHASVEILPYHEFKKDKYQELHIPYTMTENAFVRKKQIMEFEKILSSSGILIIHT